MLVVGCSWLFVVSSCLLVVDCSLGFVVVFSIGCGIESVIIPESVIEIEMEISDYYKSKINNIVGKQGSYAELWAKQNGYTFIAQ